jgi:hypothetical protein
VATPLGGTAMKKSLFFASLLLLLLFSTSVPQESSNDFSFIEVPDPLSGTNPTYPLEEMENPSIGNSFNDLRFGTSLIRATEIDGYRGRHEYSRFDPFNADQSMIILDPEELWNVYSTESFPYNQTSNLVMTVHLEEPRWDPDDSNLIWGLDEFSIRAANVLTHQTTIIKDFTQDAIIGPIITQENVFRITTRDEGESSLDKRYWAFFLQGDEQEDYNQRYIFTWDAMKDSILGVYQVAPNEVDVDYVGMSPLGNWVVIGGDPWNGGNLAGQVIANKELTQFHSLGPIGHADVGIDMDGNEVLVGQNTGSDYIDLMPLEPGAQSTHLVRLFYSSDSPHGLQSGVHISCNVSGYCVVSTYIEPGLPEKNWLDRTIILVKLDRLNPRAFYLAKVYNTTGSYWEETHATIADDGSKVVWASNWNQNVGQEQVFLMQLNMPPNWRELTTSLDVIDPPNFYGFELMQNYPNPFNSMTTARYSLPKSSQVAIRVYNVRGQLVKTLVNGEKQEGLHLVDWDATEMSSGTYFFQIVAGEYNKVRKCVLLK